jgi:hypothetical protein
MSLSYDGGLLGHLAEHMLYLSTTPSFWYSLNSSYDHGFHLYHRLGMPPLDYERLLAAANLAHYHPTWGFTILVDRWIVFILKRVPPLNCHVEISNGLSVPLSWNSWSRSSRTRGAHPLTTRSAPFWALLFSSRITLNV